MILNYDDAFMTLVHKANELGFGVVAYPLEKPDLAFINFELQTILVSDRFTCPIRRAVLMAHEVGHILDLENAISHGDRIRAEQGAWLAGAQLWADLFGEMPSEWREIENRCLATYTESLVAC